MTKIDEVARAMCEADGGDWFAADCMRTANGESPEEQRQYWTEKAIAAVKAMREPTDLMGNGLPAGYRPGSHSATEIWRAMVDAALSEESA